MTEINLRHKKISNQENSPFIIAEIGSNWTSKKDCLLSIERAKQNGADAVKFQAFTGEALYGPGHKKIAHELPIEWLPELKDFADENNIEFMCTAFSPELVKAVNPYVNIHKLSYCESTALDIIEAIHKTKKPVIVSAPLDRIYWFKEYFKDRLFVFNYCICEYPTFKTDLSALNELQNYHNLIGLSDHSKEVYSIPVNAAFRGVVAIEKHVNFCMKAYNTPDAPHSLSADDFRRMAFAIKTGEHMVEDAPSNIPMRVKTKDGWFRPKL